MKVRPAVGIGVIVLNAAGRILLGKRKGSHGAATWCPPGGHLEFGESFESCAIRETKEEVGIDISSAEFVAVTNDIFVEDNKHYISVFLKTIVSEDQQPQLLEPNKFVEWKWFSQDELPENLFLSLKNLLDNSGHKSL